MKHKLCKSAFHSFTIASDGTVGSCILDWDKNMVFGNIQLQSLSEIRASEPYRAFQRFHLSGKFPDNILCSRCGGETGEVSRDQIEDSGNFFNVVDCKINRIYVLEPSNSCSCRCIHCRRYYEREQFPHVSEEKRFMPFPLWKKAIDYIDHIGDPADIHLHWRAESFTNPQMNRMFAYLLSKGFPKSLILDSNLNNLTPAKIEAMFEAVKVGYQNLVNFDFSFSIDAASRDVYDRIRIGGNFSHVIQNAKNIIAKRNQLSLDKVHLRTQFIVEPANFHETENFIAFWEQYIDPSKDTIYIKRCHGTWPFSAEVPNIYSRVAERLRKRPYLKLDLDPNTYYQLSSNKIFTYADETNLRPPMEEPHNH